MHNEQECHSMSKGAFTSQEREGCVDATWTCLCQWLLWTPLTEPQPDALLLFQLHIDAASQL